MSLELQNLRLQNENLKLKIQILDLDIILQERSNFHLQKFVEKFYWPK